MQVEYTNFEQDRLALTDHLLEHSPTLRRQFRVAWLGLAGMLLFVGFAMIHSGGAAGDEAAAFVGFSMIVLAPCWLAFYPWYYYRLVRSRARKLIREGHNRAVLGHHTIRLSAEELAHSSEWGHGVLYWPAVERIDEGENHVFIFVSSTSAFVIPKRDFETVQDYETFVQTARRYHEQGGMPIQPGGD